MNVSKSSFFGGAAGACGGAPGGQDPIAACGYIRNPCRIWIMPIRHAAVAAAATNVDIAGRPEYAFVAEVMTIETNINGVSANQQIAVNYITIGSRPQMVQVDPFLAVHFSHDAVWNLINFDPSLPQQNYEINVDNLDAVNAAYVSAVFQGRTLAGTC